MIEFEKWHGNGNDFVIVNSIEQELKKQVEVTPQPGDSQYMDAYNHLMSWWINKNSPVKKS